PYLIKRIDDIDGDTVFEARPDTVCRDCDLLAPAVETEMSMEEILAKSEASASDLPRAQRIMDERVNFIIDSILRDVITRGTGRRALVLERGDLAGKTGTTNGPMDAWFSGYNRDVVTTTWVGFDNYTPLGKKEFGGTAALPIWIEFMRAALQDSVEQEPELPPGIVHVKIDPDTGLLAAPGQRNAIFEYFREEHVPDQGGDDAQSGTVTNGTDDLVRDIF
ncbi:MAG: peptidase, partial [Halieaceae bacterium]